MPKPLVTLCLEPSALPRLTDYFGAWSIYENSFEAARSLLESLDLSAHITAHQGFEARIPAAPTTVRGAYSIAQIDLIGILMKSESSFVSSTSTVLARRVLRQMADDSNIDAIMLFIDSPGGTVAGTADLAEAIRYARSKKPVGAYIEDLGASAAYWLASQADFIHSNKSALVGSIGTIMVLHDTSKMAEQKGIQVHIIKEGDMKGAGIPGSAITEEHRKYFQGIVSSLDAQFKQEVSEGRKLSIDTINGLQARVLSSSDALSAKLIDRVTNYDEAISYLVKSIETRKKNTSVQTPAQKTPPCDPHRSLAMNLDDVVTLQTLRDMCPGASADFYLEMLSKNATLGDAIKQHSTNQAAAIEAAIKVNPPPAAPAKTGVSSSVAQTSGASGDTDTPDFDALVRQYMRDNPTKTRQVSIVATIRSNPEAHRAYLEDHPKNKMSATKRKISDRFEVAEALLKGKLKAAS